MTVFTQIYQGVMLLSFERLEEIKKVSLELIKKFCRISTSGLYIQCKLNPNRNIAEHGAMKQESVAKKINKKAKQSL